MTLHPLTPSRLLAAVTVVVLASTGCGETLFEPVPVVREEGLAGFSASLDSIRVALRIPGLAAAIVQGGEIAWSRGFAQLLAQRILRPLDLPHTAPDVNRLANFYAIGHSSLIVRAPQQGLAFVIVANTSRLTGAYDIGQWDVMECYPARLFVESFVLGSDPLPLGRGVWNP
jgi:hypothetical protein